MTNRDLIEVEYSGFEFFLNYGFEFFAMESHCVKFNRSCKIEVNNKGTTISLRSKPERGKTNGEMTERLASHF